MTENTNATPVLPTANTAPRGRRLARLSAVLAGCLVSMLAFAGTTSAATQGNFNMAKCFAYKRTITQTMEARRSFYNEQFMLQAAVTHRTTGNHSYTGWKSPTANDLNTGSAASVTFTWTAAPGSYLVWYRWSSWNGLRWVTSNWVQVTNLTTLGTDYGYGHAVVAEGSCTIY